MTPSIPKNTAVPRAWRISAPAPVPMTSGKTPRIKAKLVIKIGRSRRRAGFDCGGEAVFAVAILNLFRELDDEDGVLTGEADKHDEADLGEDVVLHRAQPDAADRAEDAHRHDEDDRQWQRPAFVLRREQEEDEENAERENVDARVAGDLLLEGDLGPFGREARGQILFGQALDAR